MKKVEQELGDITLQWFVKAREDLWMNKKVCEDPAAPTDLIAFHAQQSAEKCIKGLLTLYQVDFPKIHDLGALIALLRPVLDKLPVSIESADRLSAFAVIPDILMKLRA
jgi:HEPN domain-containing protein